MITPIGTRQGLDPDGHGRAPAHQVSHKVLRVAEARPPRAHDAHVMAAAWARRHQYRGAMAHITGHVRIAAPIGRVFDTVADTRNEPSFNPAMTGAELLTGMEMLVELTEFERPHRLGSRTTSSMMQTSGTLTFATEGQDTVMSWDWQVRPRGWLRLLGPLSASLGGRMERRIWTGLKHQLEDDASTHPA